MEVDFVLLISLRDGSLIDLSISWKVNLFSGLVMGLVSLSPSSVRRWMRVSELFVVVLEDGLTVQPSLRNRTTFSVGTVTVSLAGYLFRSSKVHAGEDLHYDWKGLSLITSSILCLEGVNDACSAGDGYFRFGGLLMESVDFMTLCRLSVEIHLFFSLIEDGYIIRTSPFGFWNQYDFECKVVDTCTNSRNVFPAEIQALVSTGSTIYKRVAGYSEFGFEGATSIMFEWIIVPELGSFIDKCNMTGFDLQSVRPRRYQGRKARFFAVICDGEKYASNGIKSVNYFPANSYGAMVWSYANHCLIIYVVRDGVITVVCVTIPMSITSCVFKKGLFFNDANGGRDGKHETRLKREMCHGGYSKGGNLLNLLGDQFMGLVWMLRNRWVFLWVLSFGKRSGCICFDGRTCQRPLVHLGGLACYVENDMSVPHRKWYRIGLMKGMMLMREYMVPLICGPKLLM